MPGPLDCSAMRMRHHWLVLAAVLALVPAACGRGGGDEGIATAGGPGTGNQADGDPVAQDPRERVLQYV